MVGVTSIYAEAPAAKPSLRNRSEILRYLSAEPRFSVQEFTHDGKTIIVAQLDLTSGVASSWLTVYAQGHDNWFEALSMSPVVGDSFRVEQTGDRVSFTFAALKKHVLDISISGICTEPQKTK